MTLHVREHREGRTGQNLEENLSVGTQVCVCERMWGRETDRQREINHLLLLANNQSQQSNGLDGHGHSFLVLFLAIISLPISTLGLQQKTWKHPTVTDITEVW